MKLIKDIIERRLEVCKDLELNNESVKSIWHFYEVYKICINVSGVVDSDLKIKKILIKKFIQKPNFKVLNKLRVYMDADAYIIDNLLKSFKEDEDTGEVFEDFYPSDIFAVNLDMRGF